ncbi:MAG: autotransporter-associated beta strand repeat-containing protein [bacterium]
MLSFVVPPSGGEAAKLNLLCRAGWGALMLFSLLFAGPAAQADQSWLTGTTTLSTAIGVATDNDVVDNATLNIASGGSLLANRLTVGPANKATLTLTGGTLTLGTLLATNVVLGGVTNSIFTFTSGTLTTSNANDIAANILVASNAAFNVNGNWIMNGGTNTIASVQNNGTWNNVNFGYSANNTASSISSNAVLSLGNPGAAGDMILAVGYGKIGNVLTVDGGRVINVANLYVGLSSATGSQLIVTNGGQVFSGNLGGSNNQMLIGNNAANTNNGVIVTGSGSRWDTGTRNVIISQTRASNFGNYLRVADGGLVTNVGGLTVSSGGQSSYLMITNGGAVFSASGIIGNAAGANGNWGHVGGNNALWNLGRGTLVIGNNSAATNSTLTLVAGGILTNASTLTLGGVDSVFNLSGDAYVAKVNLSVSSALMSFTGGGTLHATANGSLLYGAGTNTFIGSGGMIDTAGYMVTNSAVNVGNGGLTKLGAGTLTLTGTNTYSGRTIVSAGALALSGSGAIANTTNITLAGGATFDVSGLFSAFTLGSGQTLSNSSSTATINGNVNAGLGGVSLTFTSGMPAFTVANGTFNLSPWTVFNIYNTGAPLPVGLHLIISKEAGGAVAGTVPSVTVSGGGVTNNVGTVLQTNAGALYLVVGSEPLTSVAWTGADAANPTRWNNTQNDTNWLASGSVPDLLHYYDGEQVFFNDANRGHYTVSLATPVSPGSVWVNNSSSNYAFNAAAGRITGSTGLTKDGTRSLTLNGANDFTGDTVINAGKLVIGHASALSGSSVTVNINGGLGVAVNAATLGNLAGAGSLGLTNGTSPVSLTLGGNNGDSTYAGALGGSGSLIKTGTGVFTLTGSHAIGGATTVSNGTLAVNGSLTTSALVVSGGVLSGIGIINGPVTVVSGGTLSPGGVNLGQLTINNTVSLGTGGTAALQVGNGQAASRVGGVSTLTYGGTLAVTTVAGTVLGAGDAFQLFSAAQYLGKFSVTNLPALDAGFKWDLTGLTNNGSIRVVPFWSVANVFADNMVLQRGVSVPVWGTAEPGQIVSVTFAGQTKTATAGADRNWMVRLDAMAANSNAQTLTVTFPGVTTTTYSNVLVGDVWLASGQSNMERDVTDVTDKAAEIAAANYPLIRHLKVAHNASATPVWDAPILSPWAVCSPSAVSDGTWSAVAYFFARSVFQNASVPIGILETDWGGTSAQAWTSATALNAVPELQTLAATGGTLFNGMVEPLIPFAVRGALWYQGEANANSSGQIRQYRVLLPTLIADWRSRWQQGDFPFYIVQLPNYSATLWPSMREAQLLTLHSSFFTIQT